MSLVPGIVTGAIVAVAAGLIMQILKGTAWFLSDLAGAAAALIHLGMVVSGTNFGKHRVMTTLFSVFRLGILGLIVFLALYHGAIPLAFIIGLVLVYGGLIIGMLWMRRG